MTSSRILLFDIDGVLVQPLGYRVAVRSTLEYFFPQPELKNLLPDQDDLAMFEAAGIISEWDMVAISTFLMADALIASAPNYPVPESLSKFQEFSVFHPPSKIDFRRTLIAINPFIQNSNDPSRALYEYLKKDLTLRSLFAPQLLESPLMELLYTTRDIRRSMTTRVFQNFCLGDSLFVSTYDLSPEISSYSFLEHFDRPAISATDAKIVQLLIEQGQLTASALTARPSQLKFEKVSDDLAFSPEAEQALRLVQLEKLPIIGLGAIKHAAGWGGLDPSLLRKPHPFHALAALLAAIGMPVKQALQIALESTQTGKFSGPVGQLHNAEVVIFEDSVAGIDSLRATVDLLDNNHIKLKPSYLGISDFPEKTRALKQAGAEVFVNTAEALNYSLQKIGLSSPS